MPFFMLFCSDRKRASEAIDALNTALQNAYVAMLQCPYLDIALYGSYDLVYLSLHFTEDHSTEREGHLLE